MWAARILGWPHVGLGDVLRETFDVHTNKRYQRHNWGKRPLEPQALTYASLDTHYLLPLRRLQADALAQKGRAEEAQEIFGQIAATEPSDHTFSPESFWRIKGAHDLSRREQAVLRELAIWRDGEARRQNRPHFKVLGDRTLVALAQFRPGALQELFSLDGLKQYHVRRYGKRILEAIERGTRARPPRLPPLPPRHSEAEVARFQNLRVWRRQMAAERGVDPDVILGNAVLWNLAEQNPRAFPDLARIEGLGPWKRQAYGAAILRILHIKR